ncbi:MAG: hypothetical protein ACRERD_05125, partial [Candidatus Binatia bacterium]
MREPIRTRKRWLSERWRPLLLLVSGLALVGAIGTFLFVTRGASAPLSPQAAVERYVALIYAQDYGQAYELLSEADKRVKSRESYLKENESLSGFTLDVARRLASYIEYHDLELSQEGEQAEVAVTLRLPDGDSRVLREYLYADADRLTLRGDELTAEEQRHILARLDELRASGHLPTYEVEQQFDLVR